MSQPDSVKQSRELWHVSLHLFVSYCYDELKDWRERNWRKIVILVWKTKLKGNSKSWYSGNLIWCMSLNLFEFGLFINHVIEHLLFLNCFFINSRFHFFSKNILRKIKMKIIWKFSFNSYTSQFFLIMSFQFVGT